MAIARNPYNDKEARKTEKYLQKNEWTGVNWVWIKNGRRVSFNQTKESTANDNMKKIIERNITNEDGDFYGVCGSITRLGAYRAIRQDLKEYGIDDDIELKAENLKQFNFWKTIVCPSGEHEDWIWWGKPDKEDKAEFLGKGWGITV